MLANASSPVAPPTLDAHDAWPVDTAPRPRRRTERALRKARKRRERLARVPKLRVDWTLGQLRGALASVELADRLDRRFHDLFMAVVSPAEREALDYELDNATLGGVPPHVYVTHPSHWLDGDGHDPWGTPAEAWPRLSRVGRKAFVRCLQQALKMQLRVSLENLERLDDVRQACAAETDPGVRALAEDLIAAIDARLERGHMLPYAFDLSTSVSKDRPVVATRAPIHIDAWEETKTPCESIVGLWAVIGGLDNRSYRGMHELHVDLRPGVRGEARIHWQSPVEPPEDAPEGWPMDVPPEPRDPQWEARTLLDIATTLLLTERWESPCVEDYRGVASARSGRPWHGGGHG